MVGGADDQHPHRLVAAGDREVLEQLDQHLGVDRVARLGPLEAEHGDPLLVDLVAGATLGASSFIALMLRNLAARPGARSRSAARGDQRLDLGPRLAEAAEHVGGDDLGVGRVGPPDADPHPPELGVAEARA